MIGVQDALSDQLLASVGKRLLARREALGKKRSEIARAVGYTNVSKGSRRISDWEKGSFGPLLDEAAYFAALELDATVIAAELRHARQIGNRIQQLGYDTLSAERTLLRANVLRLLKGAEQIAADPELSGVRSPATSVRILWLGGGALPIGWLVGAWNAGALVADTDAHGPVYIYDGAGSALSGAGNCQGIDRTGAGRQIKQSPSRFFTRDVSSPWREKLPPSPRSLADVVVALGGAAPCTHFHLLDDAAEPMSWVATYDPSRRVLELGSGVELRVDALCDEPLESRAHYGGVSVGGGPARPMNIGGLHLGGFRSEEVGHACGLRIREGRVEGAGGWRPVKVTGPCPPPGVLPLLAGILSKIAQEEEPHPK